MSRLVLASSSPRRRLLLEQIGIVPSGIVPPDLDETPRKREKPLPYNRRIATEKARAVQALYPDELILAADTVTSVGSCILPKAASADDVTECLEKLSGRSHRAYTTVVGLSGNDAFIHTAETRLLVKKLSPQEIALYAASGEGIGCAGGYSIQGRFATFVRKIIGSHSNVVGLPLYETAKILHSLGISVWV